MIAPLLPLRGKKVCLLGLGAYPEGSGIAAALFCLRQGVRQLTVVDAKSRKDLHENVKKLDRFSRVKFVFGKTRLSDIRGVELLVRNPGVPNDHPFVRAARDHGIPITNDIGLFLVAKPMGPIIAVTGTRGKSTTTQLIFEMVRRQYPRTFLGGNIGRSPLTFLSAMKSGDRTVLELSSWMLHDLHRPAFDIAVVTNILPDHLNRYTSMHAYQRDKERIWRWQKREQILILNACDPRVREMKKRASAKIFWFGRRQGASSVFVAGQNLYAGTTRVAAVRDIRLLGAHHQMNVCAAVAAVRILGISTANIQKTLRKFRGLPHRLEHIRTWRGIAWYNDTTATTPEAAIAALASFPVRRILLLAGGNSKGLDLSDFAKEIARRAKFLILLSGNANGPLRKVFPTQKVTEASTMRDAFACAQAHARRGDVVLLSPGCTWLPVMNEFERGRQFVALVTKLGAR